MLGGVHEHAGGLVDCEHIVTFKNNFERNVLGTPARGGIEIDLQRNGFSRTDAESPRPDLAIYAALPRLDALSQVHRGEAWQPRRQKSLEREALFAVFYKQEHQSRG